MRPATIEDAKWLAPRLRQADLDECLAATGKRPEQILPGGVALATAAYTLLTPSGNPCGVFGVSRTAYEGLGLVWMSATDEILEHTRIFLRHSQEGVVMMHDHYQTLWNVVHAENIIHRRWIEWCGFTMGAPHVIRGHDFIEFSKEK